MKQEIIDLMKANLGSGKWAKNDFDIDQAHLQNYDGRFFWASRENGTSLAKLSCEYILGMINDPNKVMAESNRIVWFQDFYAFMSSVLHWSEHDSKLFYYNGNVMLKINEEQAREVYNRLFGSMYREVKRDFKKEYEISQKKVPIKFTCPLSRIKEALYYAESIGDKSLINNLRGFRRYRRYAINQYIQIGSDFTKHGFTFAEMVNGVCRLNGGIILHEYMKANRWSIHT